MRSLAGGAADRMTRWRSVDTVYSLRWVPRADGAERTEEQVWLAAAKAGEQWALERFYFEYQAPIYALCFRLLGRTEDARDAMQSCFVNAFRELPRFRGSSNIKTWLYRIAVNEAISQIRKRRDSPELNEFTACSSDSAPAVVERVAVQAAMARLKEDHRAILVLRFWEGLDYEDIASVLGISLPAVKMRLHRAREEFRKSYEEGL